jgi:hypothetical protein
VVVLSGVKPGDAVITGPFRTLKTLKDGTAIVATKEDKKSAKSTSSSSDKKKDAE